MPAGDAGRPYGTPAEENAWDVANELRTENGRLRAQLTAQQAVIDAARQRLASADAAWQELGVSTEDTPELAIQLDPNGHWAALRTALVALDKAQIAQPEGEQG